ncbi:MAG TPA: type I-E CRISPR-associated protein Cse2/CasB [Acidobacteriota bacterium]|nr:type I-E CRISPR-associated protein Cse2/CasB [Acidobacteriota bacterium]HQG93347.1 type I-E CRISPR-associated protein Cse2/CasB [Acidobacteriota bacterium]HQK87760.1 type I-E CRISPR-associated protein Cse2/CasB [Acidobacteriota bacterium]
MSQTAEYIKRLSALQEGERSQLRRLAGRPLDATLQGFDIFTGLWWPLRANSPATPRREPSWLVAKLFGAFPVPHIRTDSGTGPTLPEVLARCEPLDEDGRKRFRTRFDALLCSSLSSLEPHVRWALGEVALAVAGHVLHARDVKGLDWVQLLDDLSIWDRGEEHRRGRDVRDIWAETYLKSVRQTYKEEE